MGDEVWLEGNEVREEKMCWLLVVSCKSGELLVIGCLCDGIFLDQMGCFFVAGSSYMT